jgi:DeoR family fructose operon transcriptional repressor
LATVDDWNLQLLSQLHVDVAFMGTNGLSIQRGFTTPDPAEASVKRAMIAAARRAVVLADHTKFGNDYLARFAEISDIDTLITDEGLDGDTAEDCERAGLRVVSA